MPPGDNPGQPPLPPADNPPPEPAAPPAGEATAETGPPPPGRFEAVARSLARGYYRVFLTGFCNLLPLPLTLLLLAGLLLGKLGDGYGTPHLLWHDEPLKQFIVGVSVSLAVFAVLLVGYLFRYRGARRAGQTSAEAVPSFPWYALVILGWFVATLLVLAGVFWVVGQLARVPLPGSEAAPEPMGGTPDKGWGLFGILAGSGLALLLFGVAARRRREPETGQAERPAARTPSAHRPAGDGHSPSEPRGLPAVAALVLLSAIWVGAAVLLGWQTFDAPGAADWRRVLAFAVFTLFVLLVVVALWWQGAYRGGFRLPAYTLLAVAHAGLAFFVVTRFGSGLGWYGLWLAALAVPPLLLGALYVGLPSGRRFVRFLAGRFVRGRRGRSGAKLPARLPPGGWTFLALCFAFFVLVSFVPALASPAPVALFFLFGAVCVYGLLKAVLRHVLSLVAVTLIFLAALAGMQPYKQRFDGFGEDAYHDPLRLADAVRADAGRNEDFMAAAGRYLRARDECDRVCRSAGAGEEQVADAMFVLAGAEADLRDAWLAAQANRVVPAVNRNVDANLPLADDRPPAARPLLLGSDLVGVRYRNDRRIVIVSVSGGGLRSAAWTFTVLKELERRFAREGKDFPAHVWLITGASGGMLGAGAYVSDLGRSDSPKPLDGGRKEHLRELYVRLTGDCLTPVMRQWAFQDAPLFFSPWPAHNDRGKALERAWSDNLGGLLDVTFDDLRRGELGGRLPSLVFTPMMVEDGRRLLVGNLDLRAAISNDGHVFRPHEDRAEDAPGVFRTSNLSMEALELFRLFPEARKSIRLSTAVRMSASFPYFSPAVSLPTWPRRRVVDAGYYDNYGVSLASSWLFSSVRQPWYNDLRFYRGGAPVQGEPKILFVQIRDGVSDEQRTLRAVGPNASTRLSRSVEEFSSPLEALDGGRVGSSSFRNDGQLEALTLWFRENRGLQDPGDWPEIYRQRFVVANFELPEPAALSWYLSKDERDRIWNYPGPHADGEDPNSPEARFRRLLDEVVRWWQYEPEEGA